MANGEVKTAAQSAQAAKDAADRQARIDKDAADASKRQADSDAAASKLDPNPGSMQQQYDETQSGGRGLTGDPLVDRGPGGTLQPRGGAFAPNPGRVAPANLGPDARSDLRPDLRPDVVGMGDAEARQSQSDAADRADPLRAVRRGDYAPTAAEPFEPDDEDAKRAEQLRSENRDIAGKIGGAAAAKAKAEAEYAALVNQQQLKNAELLKLVGQPARRPTNIAEYAAQAKRPSERYPQGEKLVNVFVPKAFQHRLDDHQLIQVLPGSRQVPASMVDHWWFRANGVVPL